MEGSDPHESQNGDPGQGQQNGLQPFLPFNFLPLIIVEFQHFVELLEERGGIISLIVFDLELDLRGIFGGDLFVDAPDFLQDRLGEHGVFLDPAVLLQKIGRLGEAKLDVDDAFLRIDAIVMGKQFDAAGGGKGRGIFLRFHCVRMIPFFHLLKRGLQRSPTASAANSQGGTAWVRRDFFFAGQGKSTGDVVTQKSAPKEKRETRGRLAQSTSQESKLYSLER